MEEKGGGKFEKSIDMHIHVPARECRKTGYSGYS